MVQSTGDRPRHSDLKLSELATEAGLHLSHAVQEGPLARGGAEHIDHDGHRWHVEFGYALTDGQLQPVSVTISSANESGDRAVPLDGAYRRITTALLRSMPIASIEERARENVTRRAAVRLALEQLLARDDVAGETEALDQARRDLRIATSNGPESIHLRLVAALYTEAWSRGERAPAKAVARYYTELRGEAVTSVTTRNWIRRCRQVGLLPPTEARKARA